MARPATGKAAALTSFKPWPNGSMPAPSIRPSPPCSPGSSSTRSGGTAPRAASMFATATALMIERLARMSVKVSATKTSNPTSDHIGLLVLGFDEQQKPCGARFVGDKPDLVAKAAQLMGLNVYKPSSPDIAEVAKKLPVGQLYANGRAFVPNIRQTLYSDLMDTKAARIRALNDQLRQHLTGGTAV